VPGIGVHERFPDDVSGQRAPPRHRCLERVGLEPEQHAVAMRCRIGITEVRMVVRAPGVELKDQLPVLDQPFVLRPAVAALPAEKLPVLPAARGHVPHGDERLHSHGIPFYLRVAWLGVT
jgi:hypothetical protein